MGLKRGLSEDLVIAPYATALAAMIDPAAAAKNFRALARVGGRGEFGFYEAIDYTRSRLPENADRAVVKAYMAHHQGMTIVALANVVTGWKMRRRFHAEPMVQATELLLQERTPRDVGGLTPSRRGGRLAAPRPGFRDARPAAVPVAARRDAAGPSALERPLLRHDDGRRIRLLALRTDRGDALARGPDARRLGQLRLSAGRPEPARSGRRATSRAGPRRTPTTSRTTRTASRSAGATGAWRRCSRSSSPPEDDAELRQVSVTNLGIRPREIELTSYAEIVLNDQKADDAHPAFSNLFVQTEFVPGLEALVATRRPRSADDPRIWAAHLAVAEGSTSGTVQFETDRARFIGRGRDVRNAVVMHEGLPLSNTGGRRPRSDLQPPPPGPPRARRHGADHVRDARRAQPGAAAPDRRPLPGPVGLRAHGHAGVDPGAGPAPSSPDLGGRGASLPAAGDADPLLRPDASRRPRGV